MRCKDCNHFHNTRIGSRGAVYGSCKLKNSVSYTDIRNGKAHSCKHFEASKEVAKIAIKALQTEQLKESQENFNKNSAPEFMLNADLISRQVESCEDAISRKNCKYRHENGNCLAVGGFCLSVDDEHCQYEAVVEDTISREQAIKQCGFGMTSLLIADSLRKLPSIQPKQAFHEDTMKVLEKIRAEIEQKLEQEEFARSVFRHEEKDYTKANQCTGSIMAYRNVLKMLDKYMKESEEV